MRSKQSREGYLLIDNRLSKGGIFESATVTCSHCHTIVVLNPDRSRPRNYCRKCDHYVCDKINCLRECYPFNEVLEKLQIQFINKGG